MIKLDVTVCDSNVNYVVTFEGTHAEDHALAFMDRRAGSHNHVIGEVVATVEVYVPCPYGGDDGRIVFEPAREQPDLIDPERFPRLYRRMNPICHHGMSADLCMDPIGEHHWGTREWEMAQPWAW